MEAKLIDKQTTKVIATGTREQMFSYIKHHVPDGLYIIDDDGMRLYCERKGGVVSQDPDGAPAVEKRRI